MYSELVNNRATRDHQMTTHGSPKIIIGDPYSLVSPVYNRAPLKYKTGSKLNKTLRKIS